MKPERLITFSACVGLFAFGVLASSGSAQRAPRPSHVTTGGGDATLPAGGARSQDVAVGDMLFHDKTLSEPPGMACVTCHAPEAGFSYPVSDVNKRFGTVPGAIKERFGNRKPLSLAYATYLPTGVPRYDPAMQAFVGGLFWDGRAADAVAQAKSPFLNPNEMNNLVHNVGSPERVVRKVATGPSGKLFREVYGAKVFQKPASQVYDLIARSIAAYEASPAVSPFTSKYDAWLEGKAKFTSEELFGMMLTTGHLDGRPDGLPARKSAHCMDCHGISSDLSKGRDLWTNGCYANLGVPRNSDSPFYGMTDPRFNPAGYNRLGKRYVDLGLGGFLYPKLGLLPGDFEHDDPLGINGTFRAPSLRNVDKRPYPEFVKCYMHNGALKSLKDVVHFYNTRNLTTSPGEVIDFTRADPYAGLKGKPLWDRPEYLDPKTLSNPTGTSTLSGFSDPDAAQIGNLRLSERMEDAIVAFLRTLSDGYFKRE